MAKKKQAPKADDAVQETVQEQRLCRAQNYTWRWVLIRRIL